MHTNLYKSSLILILSMYIGCNPSMIESSFELEQQISKNWQFVSIEANGINLVNASDGFDPYQTPGGLWIPWYWFSYNSDMSYEFRSDVNGGYESSYGYEANYQPDYGYWEIIEGEPILLVHNKGMAYEKAYRIIGLGDTILVREYEHIIYQLRPADTVYWHVGDTVTYRETLRLRRGPCCNN